MPRHRLDKIDLEQATVDVCWRLARRTGVGLLRRPPPSQATTTSGGWQDQDHDVTPYVGLPTRCVTALYTKRT